MITIIFMSTLILLSFIEVITKNEIIKKNTYLISSITVLFFIGFGYRLGVDWVEYENVFYNRSIKIENYEIGYLYLNEFLSYIKVPYWVFSITIKIIYLTSLIFMLYKYTRLPTLALTFTVYMLFPFFNDPLRQLISATIMIATFLLFNRSNGIISIILGSLFHTSYPITACAFLVKIKRTTIIYSYIIFSLITIVLLSSLNAIPNIEVPILNILFDKLKFYLQYAQYSNPYSLILRIAFLIFICFSITVSKNNISMIGLKNEKTFWIYSITYLLLELSLFMLPIVTQRIRIYFIPFVFILFCNYIFAIKKTILKIAILIVTITYLLGSLYLFISKPIGSFYNLNNNLLIHIFIDKENLNTIEKVNLYWSSSDR